MPARAPAGCSQGSDGCALGQRSFQGVPSRAPVGSPPVFDADVLLGEGVVRPLLGLWCSATFSETHNMSGAWKSVLGL